MTPERIFDLEAAGVFTYEGIARANLMARRMSDTARSTILLKTSQCRWPIGNPGDPNFHYCTNTSQERGSYCAVHHEASRSKVVPLFAQDENQDGDKEAKQA